VDGGFVADGEFVVSGGDGAVAFEPVDAALDGVALLVDLRVERWWTAAVGSFVLAVADLVGFLRDGAPDTPPSQIAAVGSGSVGLVRQRSIRSGAGPAAADAGDSDTAQYHLELRGVAALPGGDDQGEWLLGLFGGQVQLGGPPASRLPQRVISRLWVSYPAGWFLLRIPFLRAPAACWCARAMVESTLTSQVINPAASASACNRARIAAQIPARCQRRNSP
jgi:hypothetical protein